MCASVCGIRIPMEMDGELLLNKAKRTALQTPFLEILASDYLSFRLDRRDAIGCCVYHRDGNRKIECRAYNHLPIAVIWLASVFLITISVFYYFLLLFSSNFCPGRERAHASSCSFCFQAVYQDRQKPSKMAIRRSYSYLRNGNIRCC